MGVRPKSDDGQPSYGHPIASATVLVLVPPQNDVVADTASLD